MFNEVLCEKHHEFRQNSTTEVPVNQILNELLKAEKNIDKFLCIFRFGKSI